MTAPIKISALPVLGTVVVNDILPVVDSAATTTSRVTAGQIAALWGGDMSDGTVTSVKLANAAVTAAKVYFTAADKLITKTAAGAGSGVEIVCTAFARSILACNDSGAVQAVLGALSLNNPTFTGTVTVTGNLNTSAWISAANYAGPAAVFNNATYTWSGDATTGIGRQAAGSVSIRSTNVEQYRIGYNGDVWRTIKQSTASDVMFNTSAGIRASGYFIADNTGTNFPQAINISSITYFAAGRYYVNFTQAMPDLHYAPLLLPSGDARVTDGVSTTTAARVFAKTLSQFQATFYDFGEYGGGSWQTPAGFSVVVVR